MAANNAMIAKSTQQTSDLACDMVVVDGEVSAFFFDGLSAEGATSFLTVK